MSRPTDPAARGALVLSVLDQVRPLVLNSARAVEAMWRADGVTVGMRAVLRVLHEAGPLPVPAIAERLDLARQGVQRQVNDLGALGLAQARPNPAHRRSVLIAATDRGQQLYARIHRAELAQLGAYLALDCTEQDLRTTVQVLSALDRDVQERARALRAGQPMT